MKKILLVFLSVFLLVPSFAYGEAAKQIGYETECPSDYKGTSKCVVVELDEYRNKNVVQEEKGVTNEPLKTTSDGNSLMKHPVAWAVGTSLAYASSQSEIVNNAVSSWWDNVNAVDLVLGDIANNLSDSSAVALQNAWDQSLSTGNRLIDISATYWDEIFDTTTKRLQQEAEFSAYYNEKFGEAYDYDNVMSKAFSLYEMHASSSSYVNTIIQMGYDSKNEPLIFYIQYHKSQDAYNPRGFSFTSSGDYKNQFGAGSTGHKTYQEAYERFQQSSYSSMIVSPVRIKEEVQFDYNDYSEHAYPVLPNFDIVGIPKIVNVPGKGDFIEVPSSYPNMPDLLPLDNTVPEKTRQIIEADTGFPIADDGSLGVTPVSPPIANPLPSPVTGEDPVLDNDTPPESTGGLWDWLLNILKQMLQWLKNIYTLIANLVNAILTGISTLLSTLFIPSNSFMTDNLATFKDTLETKFPWFYSLLGWFDDFEGSITEEDWPGIKATIPFIEKEMIVVSPTFVNSFKSIMKGFIGVMMITLLIIYLVRNGSRILERGK